MNQPMFELAKRAAADSSFMAYLVDQQAKRENVSWEQLATILKIEPMQLAKLALCKQPREANFSQDVALIVGYSGINRTMLLHLMDCARQGSPIKKNTVQRAVPARKSTRNWKGRFSMLHRRTWAFSLATLLVLILGAFVLAQPGGAEATLVVSAGEVVVNQAGGAIFAGSADTAVSAGHVITVQEGDTIRLNDSASAQLRLQDGTTVDLFSGTTLAVSELVTNDDSFRVRLNLLSGKTLNRVVRLLRSDDAFEVKTPSSTASVRGTVFTVEVQTAEMSVVSVDEGVVRVTLGDQYVDVEPGFQVTAVVGQELKVVPQNAPPEEPTPAPTAKPTDTPTPEPVEERIEPPTAVPTPTKADNTVPTDKAKGPPDQVPGNTPDEVPGEGDPPDADGTPPGQTDDGNDGDEPTTGKMVICHYPGGDLTKGETIEIDADAWPAHQAHGDTEGACSSESTGSGDEADASSSDNNGNAGGNSDNAGNSGNAGGNSGNAGGNGGGKP